MGKRVHCLWVQNVLPFLEGSWQHLVRNCLEYTLSWPQETVLQTSEDIDSLSYEYEK